jgi:hypothetical protein
VVAFLEEEEVLLISEAIPLFFKRNYNSATSNENARRHSDVKEDSFPFASSFSRCIDDKPHRKGSTKWDLCGERIGISSRCSQRVTDR